MFHLQPSSFLAEPQGEQTRNGKGRYRRLPIYVVTSLFIITITGGRLNKANQCYVCHGAQEPWHNWDILSGRFETEFGMHANVISLLIVSVLLSLERKRDGIPDILTLAVNFWHGCNKAEHFPQSCSVTF